MSSQDECARRIPANYGARPTRRADTLRTHLTARLPAAASEFMSLSINSIDIMHSRIPDAAAVWRSIILSFCRGDRALTTGRNSIRESREVPMHLRPIHKDTNVFINRQLK